MKNFDYLTSILHPPKMFFEFLKSLKFSSECTYEPLNMKSLDSKLPISWTWDFYEACKDCCVALQGVVRSQAGDRGRQGPDISGDLLSSSWLLAFSLSSLLGPNKPRMNPLTVLTWKYKVKVKYCILASDYSDSHSLLTSGLMFWGPLFRLESF